MLWNWEGWVTISWPFILLCLSTDLKCYIEPQLASQSACQSIRVLLQKHLVYISSNRTGHEALLEKIYNDDFLLSFYLICAHIKQRGFVKLKTILPINARLSFEWVRIFDKYIPFKLCVLHGSKYSL